MSRGKRYSGERKLNYKKVFAVIIAIIVVIMFVYIIRAILQKGQDGKGITSESYFACYDNENWGVINSKGETVIEPGYKEMIIIPDSKRAVFLCTYDVNYETGEYKTKALDDENKEIFTRYEQIEPISNIDSNNNLWYEENVLRVRKDGKYGLINLDGKEILKCEYDDIQALEGIKNALIIKKDNKVGIADTEGTIKVKPEYKEITNLGNDYQAGYITINEEDKYGIVNNSNETILENKYENIEKVYGNNMYVVQEEKQKLVNQNGEVILEDGFNEIKEIMQDGESIIFISDGNYGIMSTSGDIIMEPAYEDLKEAASGILIAQKDGKYGVIDLEQNEKIPFQYTNISYVKQANIYIAENEDLTSSILDNNFEVKLTGILTTIDTEKGYMELRMDDGYKYYNFRFEEKKDTEILTSNTLFLRKKDGKYGYVDKNEQVVVDYIYDDATKQNQCGYAGVKKDGKWGSIGSNGNVIIEPTYDLENYLLIDFIGRWHLGQDINMNYYNQNNN